MNDRDDRREGERVQKLIARAGIESRRGAEELIRQGRVTINGQTAELGSRATAQDSIKIDGRALRGPVASRTIVVNKPPGVITTLSDPEGRRTVLDLIPPRLRRGLFPVGRLDFATEGLLLLTTDGDLAQRIAHPRNGCQKTYEVKVKGTPDERAIERLRGGIRLHGKPLAPVEIERRVPPGPSRRRASGEASSNSWWKVRLVEGKTRQIREMFQRIGHPVQRLRRTQIGGLSLQGLRPGDHRELEEQDLQVLLAGPRRALAKRPRPGRSATSPKNARRRSTEGGRSGSRKPTGGRGESGGRRRGKPTRGKDSRRPKGRRR